MSSVEDTAFKYVKVGLEAGVKGGPVQALVAVGATIIGDLFTMGKDDGKSTNKMEYERRAYVPVFMPCEYEYINLDGEIKTRSAVWLTTIAIETEYRPEWLDFLEWTQDPFAEKYAVWMTAAFLAKRPGIVIPVEVQVSVPGLKRYKFSADKAIKKWLAGKLKDIAAQFTGCWTFLTPPPVRIEELLIPASEAQSHYLDFFPSETPKAPKGWQYKEFELKDDGSPVTLTHERWFNTIKIWGADGLAHEIIDRGNMLAVTTTQASPVKTSVGSGELCWGYDDPTIGTLDPREDLLFAVVNGRIGDTWPDRKHNGYGKRRWLFVPGLYGIRELALLLANAFQTETFWDPSFPGFGIEGAVSANPPKLEEQVDFIMSIGGPIPLIHYAGIPSTNPGAPLIDPPSDEKPSVPSLIPIALIGGLLAWQL